MADTTKKKSTTTTAKTVNKTESVEKVVEKIDTAKKTYNPSDEIECVSVTAGGLIMIGRKTNNVYRWMGYGDTQLVEYQDLKAEKFNKLSHYMYDPLFVINDEELLESPEFKEVADVYGNMLSVEDIDAIFNLDLSSFRKTLQNLPVGLKNTIKSLAASKIQDGSLDSINKIKEIDSILETDLFNSYVAE